MMVIDAEMRDKRARSLAAMGLVVKDGNVYRVSSPSLRGKQTIYTVSRTNGLPLQCVSSRIVCDCLEFEENEKDLQFRCEHILAVKYYVANLRELDAKKDAQNKSVEQADTHKSEASWTSTLDNNGIFNICYHAGSTIIPYAIQVNQNCVNQKAVAEKIVKMLNETQPINIKPSAEYNAQGFPVNPIAKSLSDLITAKQLGMIRAMCRALGIDENKECQTAMQCKTDELSKRAASAFIQYLQGE